MVQACAAVNIRGRCSNLQTVDKQWETVREALYFLFTIDVGFDGGVEFVDTVEDAAANAFVGEFTKPALDQIQPGGAGGHEMQYEARPFSQPVADFRMLLRTVVVQDQM